MDPIQCLFTFQDHYPMKHNEKNHENVKFMPNANFHFWLLENMHQWPGQHHLNHRPNEILWMHKLEEAFYDEK